MKEIKIHFPNSTKKQQAKLGKALSRLPEEAITFLSKHKVIFIKNPNDALAFIIRTKNFTKNDTVIVLNPDIWALNKDEFLYVIAHEIIHHYLGHNEISKENEKEAHNLTKEWVINILKSEKCSGLKKI